MIVTLQRLSPDSPKKFKEAKTGPGPQLINYLYVSLRISLPSTTWIHGLAVLYVTGMHSPCLQYITRV